MIDDFRLMIGGGEAGDGAVTLERVRVTGGSVVGSEQGGWLGRARMARLDGGGFWYVPLRLA